MGQGRVPAGYDPLANALGEQRVSAWMNQVREGINQTVDKLPAHGAFIDAMRRADTGDKAQEQIPTRYATER